ncbi:hypothetical protein OSB04_008626 [Centaurea solstitialis]|uniref:Protein yippee-like n=1 Tax=Centaurea solstitialis TaxID=347529 RepID=A0AA38WTZ7_9ASTR|nr:hypothetical protein OSB04_008626 [Centaurea solstitialis]
MADVIHSRLYACYNCHNYVALHDDIISKDYVVQCMSFIIVGRRGYHHRIGFLFSHTMNLVAGPKEVRQMITSWYTASDVACSDCGKVLGWQYVKAHNESQKFKESKFMLEKSKIVKNNW